MKNPAFKFSVDSIMKQFSPEMPQFIFSITEVQGEICENKNSCMHYWKGTRQNIDRSN